MYYDPRTGSHGLPRDPFTSLVVPRPIGWISTVSKSGVVNLAPYSYFNAITSKPPHVLFVSNGRKDSQRNAEETGEFVANLATYELREAVNLTSIEAEADVSEPALAALEMTPSVSVRPPRVARCPVAMECQYVKTVKIETDGVGVLANSIIIGRVVGIYIDDRVIKDGRIDLSAIRPIARLGYMDYAIVDEIFLDGEAAKDGRRKQQGGLNETAFGECAVGSAGDGGIRGERTRLSDPADQDRGTVCARRRHRHVDAPRC